MRQTDNKWQQEHVFNARIMILYVYEVVGCTLYLIDQSEVYLIAGVQPKIKISATYDDTDQGKITIRNTDGGCYMKAVVIGK